jgi:DNA-binding PadR family transcriptional regulator
MSLEHAILGFLSYGPMSGYDLKAMFDVSVRHFWPADQSQIYRTLARLSDRGWAEVELVEQEKRPDRKVYHLTQEGRDELHLWLLAPLIEPGARIPALVQVFFAGLLPDEEALGVLRRFEERCREELEHLRGIPAQCADNGAWAATPPREALFAKLTLDYGIRTHEATLAWLEEAIDRLQSGEWNRGAETCTS